MVHVVVLYTLAISVIIISKYWEYFRLVGSHWLLYFFQMRPLLWPRLHMTLAVGENCCFRTNILIRNNMDLHIKHALKNSLYIYVSSMERALRL